MILFLTSLFWEKKWKTQFSSVHSLSPVWLSATPWTTACHAFLSTNSWSLLKLMSIKSVMPSNHLILSRLLLFLPSIFTSMRVFSNESVLCIRWPKYWSFNFSISPSSEYSGLISFRIDWFDLLAVHRVTKSWTRLSNFPLTFHFHALEKEMATHSSVLAWRIPGTVELGGLPSMGSHRVGHD